MAAEAKRRSERVTGVSNIAYDLMVILTNKLEGVAAMEEYKRDAESDQQVLDLLNRIEKNERTDIDQLKGLLLQRLK